MKNVHRFSTFTALVLSSGLVAACGGPTEEPVAVPSLTPVDASTSAPPSTSQSSSTSSPSASSTDEGSGGQGQNVEPVTDGVTTIGPLEGGMLPRYAGEIVREGSRIQWRDGEKLAVGWVVTSPTVRNLGDCPHEVEIRSADGGFTDEGWENVLGCDMPEGYHFFALDRIGDYTLEFQIRSKEMELRQEITFTVTD